MSKKLIACLTCLMCLIGCSCNTENLEKVKENQTVEKEETKTENKQEESKDQKKDDSYDNKDSSSSISSEKQSSNNDQAVKSTSIQAKKTSQSSDNKTNNTSTSTAVKDQEVPTSPPSSKSTKEPSIPVTPTPAPEPVVPSVACPGGIDQNQTCDVILDQNYYFATFASESEAASQGQYYLDEVMYIGDVEITNYSIQPVYRNDRSIAYYGLNLWSNGSLIQ